MVVSLKKLMGMDIKVFDDWGFQFDNEFYPAVVELEPALIAIAALASGNPTNRTRLSDLGACEGACQAALA